MESPFLQKPGDLLLFAQQGESPTVFRLSLLATGYGQPFDL